MFPFFHIFFPLFVLEFLISFKKIKLEKIQRFWLILGSILPDLIDKPISLITKTISGRGIAHTPIFLFILCSTIFILTKKTELSLSLGSGIIFHLLLDIPSVPWLWPLIPLEFYSFDFNDWIFTILHNPLIISTEIIGFIGLFGIIYYYKIIFSSNLVNWQNFHSFLFESPKIITND
ncbi:MAG: metal-dependent hydrolase [Promethearchaeota archaeon]